MILISCGQDKQFESMCGIFGVILPVGEKPDQDLVKRATDLLNHRGPDDGGYFFENNVALGNRRLAILDLSDQGHQPMSYKGLTITYNGEIYNYRELREQLMNKGYPFNTQTDTEVVLAAYHAWGKDCVSRFNGMWAFAIYDPLSRKVFCSRDRFGIKPFYYVAANHSLSFASEIKAFQPLAHWQPKLNTEMAYDYLVRGLQNHSEETLYQNVKQLKAGHHLIYDLDKSTFQIKRYYNWPSPLSKSVDHFETAAKAFRALLSDAIRLHSRSDVKVGSALSGGLDSSSIVALQYKLLERNTNTLETVSYSSEIPEYDESPYVESLLKKYPVRLHQTSSSFETTMALIDEVILAHDEPLQSASLIAQYLVFRTAKENGLKVMLDGQGADEILAGYGTYYIPFLKEIGWQWPLLLFQEIIGLLGKHQIKPSKKLSFFRSKPDLDQYLKLSPSAFKAKNNSFRDYSIYMIEKGILPALLQFEDRNSMAHSVESRVPFLDYRLVEYCINLPPEFLIQKGVRKAVLREAMSDLLPQKILKRYDKMGFSTPQNHWMDQHSRYFKERIFGVIDQFPSLFHPGLKKFTAEVFRKKKEAHYAFLWRIMAFGRWHQLLLS